MNIPRNRFALRERPAWVNETIDYRGCKHCGEWEDLHRGDEKFCPVRSLIATVGQLRAALADFNDEQSLTVRTESEYSPCGRIARVDLRGSEIQLIMEHRPD